MGVYWGTTETDYLNSLSGNDALVLNLDATLRSSYSGTGSTWTDLAGSQQNATLFNSPTFTTDDVKGGCFSFNGTNQYATVPDVTGVTDLDRQDFTLEYWIKYDSSATTSQVFDKNESSNRYPFRVEFSSSNKNMALYISDGNLSGTVSSVTLNSGWCHAVHTLDITSGSYTWYTYLNGDQFSFGSQGFFTQSMANASPLYIGRAGDGTSYFKGKIAVFKIYTRALTYSEVVANYNVYKSRFGL